MMELNKNQGFEMPLHLLRRLTVPRRADGTVLEKSEVRCPFYCCDDGRRSIVCEGFVEDSTVTLHYRFKHLFDKQMEVFCCKHFKNCEVYRMGMEKYEM